MTMTIEKIEFPRRETKQSKSKKALTIDSDDEPEVSVKEPDPVIAPLEPTTTENNRAQGDGSIVRGKCSTQSVYMSELMGRLMREYAESKNLKQRDVVEGALIEYFKRYGYQREVDKLLQMK
ncbi:MAG: hypothetical protein PHR06_07190 [Candidatus Cloacimonetes bacterium]|nr:hypothetical protein [Candidatus Cloacimonadota bacterium]